MNLLSLKLRNAFCRFKNIDILPDTTYGYVFLPDKVAEEVLSGDFHFHWHDADGDVDDNDDDGDGGVSRRDVIKYSVVTQACPISRRNAVACAELEFDLKKLEMLMFRKALERYSFMFK